jgi:transposase
MGLCAEVGDFSRFDHPAKLSAYLGIVPSEHTTDIKRRLGSITKGGSSHARRLLVEAAWHYRRHPSVGETLERRVQMEARRATGQRGVEPHVIDIAWRCNSASMTADASSPNDASQPGVINIACARELACFVWEAATSE